MARYEHLPIYKKAMDLAIHMEKIVRNFSRYHKYTVGSELRRKSREVEGVIITGSSNVEKIGATRVAHLLSHDVRIDRGQFTGRI